MPEQTIHTPESAAPALIIPRRGPKLTLGAAGCGLLILLWLGTEDSRVGTVTILGAGLALIGAALLVVRHLSGRGLTQRQVLAGSILLGAGVGASSAPAALLLMLLKSAVHAHSYPDFSPAIMGGTLARLPAWALAGALLGLSAGLLWNALHPACPRIPPDQDP